MSDQLIITLGREFGSGGHAIAVELANRYGIQLYDHNLLDAVAAEKNVDVETLRRYDEKPKKLLFSRSQNGFSSSAEENVAFLQFEYLKKKADEGESFIVVGRCAETVLGDRPNVISLFVLGDREVKCKRVMEVYDLSERDAQFKMERHDKYRKQYHNYYCKDKWGDSRAYDLCINSSRLGFDETVNELEDYINRRRKMFK